ncbi:MAG: 3-deoxy-D-manno-octulosonic acid transferase [bacterium]
MRFFYTIVIYLYTLGIRVAALFGHGKARLMIEGWKECVNADAIPQYHNNAIKTAWFHAASLGEFEQARPVLERWREKHPEGHVVVTFFSPSGYEVRKNYALADAILYLPPDLPKRVQYFLETYHPTEVYFIKYEFWFNYLSALKKRGIPTYIFSTIFRPDQYFFRWYGGWFRRQLRTCFTHLFVQNEESLKLLKDNGITQCSLAGDTRFDRVHQIALAAEHNEIVETFLNNYSGHVLVGGSTWPPDEELISKSRIKNEELRIILAPHVISEEHIKQIEILFPNSIRYSKCANVLMRECVSDTEIAQSHNNTLSQPKVLIIDNIGLLSKLYRYATVAYIGGGFGVGIHNILEAVTFGKPVFFGPNYHKFQEAKDIIARGGGWSICCESDLVDRMGRLLTNPEAYCHASQACTDYMNANLGSTEIILKGIGK